MPDSGSGLLVTVWTVIAMLAVGWIFYRLGWLR
jgi:hypothetical protein